MKRNHLQLWKTHLAANAVVILVGYPLVVSHHEGFTVRIREMSPSLVFQLVTHLEVSQISRLLRVLSFDPRTFDCGTQTVLTAVEQFVWFPEERNSNDYLFRQRSFLDPIVHSVLLKSMIELVSFWWSYFKKGLDQIFKLNWIWLCLFYAIWRWYCF